MTSLIDEYMVIKLEVNAVCLIEDCLLKRE